MSGSSLTTEQILAMLAAVPPRLAALTDGLREDQLHAAPNPGEWSANAVLAHLRSCADVWGSCMETILTQDRPTIRAMNPRTWMEKTDYLEQDFVPSLQAFSTQRTQLLARLEPLTPEQWSRSATVTGAGKTLERSVRFYAEWLATHERPHVKQMERIAKSVKR